MQDHGDLSEYERLREANIKRNREVMRAWVRRFRFVLHALHKKSGGNGGGTSGSSSKRKRTEKGLHSLRGVHLVSQVLKLRQLQRLQMAPTAVLVLTLQARDGKRSCMLQKRNMLLLRKPTATDGLASKER